MSFSDRRDDTRQYASYRDPDTQIAVRIDFSGRIDVLTLLDQSSIARPFQYFQEWTNSTIVNNCLVELKTRLNLSESQLYRSYRQSNRTQKLGIWAHPNVVMHFCHHLAPKVQVALLRIYVYHIAKQASFQPGAPAPSDEYKEELDNATETIQLLMATIESLREERNKASATADESLEKMRKMRASSQKAVANHKKVEEFYKRRILKLNEQKKKLETDAAIIASRTVKQKGKFCTFYVLFYTGNNHYVQTGGDVNSCLATRKKLIKKYAHVEELIQVRVSNPVAFLRNVRERIQKNGKWIQYGDDGRQYNNFGIRGMGRSDLIRMVKYEEKLMLQK